MRRPRASNDPSVRTELTERQREVLRLIAKGLTNSQIAKSLDLSLDGAKWHVREILTRLGVESREEAAEWWRQHRGSQERMPGWLGWPLVAGVGGATALAGIGIVVASVLLANGDENPGAIPVHQQVWSTEPTLVVEGAAVLPEGVSVELGPGSANSAQMIPIVTPVHHGRASPAIKVFDSATGLEIASIRAEDSPVALVRPATGDIVVSDRDASTGRVFVLDASNAFSASATVEIPSRVGFSSYQPAMALSFDEKYLAVKQVLNRDGIVACQGGGSNLLCEDSRFVFVDLDTMSITGEIALKRGCGGHSAFASPGGFVVKCSSSGYVAEVSPQGEVLREVDFSALQDMQLNPLRRGAASLVFAAVVDGRFVVYRTDGLMIAEDGTAAPVIPEGELIDEWFALPDDLFVARLRIPTRAYVVFDMRTFEVLGLHEVPGLASIAPAGGDQIWTLSDGIVQLRNVLTGEVVADIQVEVGNNAYLLP